MSFSINEFTSSLTQGLARACNFDVTITAGSGGSTNGLPTTTGNAITSPLNLRCKAAPDPGRALATRENMIYGPFRKMAYNQIFQDATLTFFISPERHEKLFFMQWQDMAIGFARGINGPRTGMFDVGYYNDYIGQVDIKGYNDNGQLTYTCSLFEAYPIGIQDMGLSWENDNFIELNVTFAYRYLVDQPDLYQTEDPSGAAGTSETGTTDG